MLVLDDSNDEVMHSTLTVLREMMISLFFPKFRPTFLILWWQQQ